MFFESIQNLTIGVLVLCQIYNFYWQKKEDGLKDLYLASMTYQKELNREFILMLDTIKKLLKPKGGVK